MRCIADFTIIFLFCKAGFNKLYKLFYSLLLIGTAGNNADICTAHNTEGKNTEKALCVYSSFFLLKPDLRLEFISLLDKESSRTSVKTNLILNFYIFNKHNLYLPHILF